MRNSRASLLLYLIPLLVDHGATAVARQRCPKVFGIGMIKTGTSSLGAALDALGYHTMHGPWKDGLMLDDTWFERPDEWPKYYDVVRRRVDEFEAFEDYPWLYLYKQLDEWYPGSLFVLTVRESLNDLIDSNVNMLLRLGLKHLLRSANAYVDRYIEHTRGVLEYFRNRSNLLVLNIIGGDGWKPLCRFLRLPVPKMCFPHLNPGPPKLFRCSGNGTRGEFQRALPPTLKRTLLLRHRRGCNPYHLAFEQIPVPVRASGADASLLPAPHDVVEGLD